MIELLYRFFAERASRRNLLLAGVTWLALAGGILLLRSHLGAATGGLSPADLQPLYGPDRFYDLLEAYGEHGRRIYLRFVLLDMIYPIAAYGFAALAMAALVRARTSQRTWQQALVSLPIAGLAVELLEQLGFLAALLAFPRRLAMVVWPTSGLTALKFLLLASVIAALSALVLFTLWRAAQHALAADRA